MKTVDGRRGKEGVEGDERLLLLLRLGLVLVLLLVLRCRYSRLPLRLLHRRALLDLLLRSTTARSVDATHFDPAERLPPELDGFGTAHEDEDLAALTAFLLSTEELAEEGEEGDEAEFGRDDDVVVLELRGRGETGREGERLGLFGNLSVLLLDGGCTLLAIFVGRGGTLGRARNGEVPPDRLADENISGGAQDGP